ncbi:MAG: hypothetical protein AAGN46_04190 [Acidobacteriota bacterium]
MTPRRALGSWLCADCGEAMRGTAPQSSLCLRCAREAAGPEPLAPPADRAVHLAARGWPDDLVAPFDPASLPGGRWPTLRGMDLAIWHGGQPTALTISGPVGTGKSMAATELCWRFATETPGTSIAYVTGRELAHRVARGDDRRLLQVEALLVDDIDRGVMGEGWELVNSVLLPRLGGERITLVTTNLHLTKSQGRRSSLFEASAPLADRLRSRGLIWLTQGASQRRAWSGGSS